MDLELWVREDNKVMYRYFEKSMIPDMVVHRRSAIPESNRRATLNQEMIRRMVNTSEMVGDDQRLEIVDKYAKKLINSEYSLEYTRNAIVGGLKGYERLLSLSKDVKNPRWKPLHMPASWNARNRRVAKMSAKTSWYKGKKEVELPSSQLEGNDEPSSHQDESSRMEGREDTSSHQEEEPQPVDQKTMNKTRNKKRGKDRGSITLGGLKKVEKARKRKMKQKLRKKLGEMKLFQRDGNKMKRKGPPPPTRSVLFMDNTVNGELAKRLT